ncbi:MAG: hypothetical protein H0X33_11295 [Taibaiella sp.]|nr:hypothetical protein [Taibaiella sp.]
MASNFSTHISFDGKSFLAIVIPQLRKDGMYYEVNIKDFPRFFMAWSPLGRYDVVSKEDLRLPYNMLLAVSDAIEARRK